MAAPDTLEQEREIEEIAKAVLSGEDRIDVPRDLTEDPEESAPSGRADPPESLYAKIAAMTVAQKVKLAIKGNKDARAILLRNPNRLVQRMVMQNPRIGEEEVMMLAKSRNTDEEILRMISDNRDWTSHYLVRAALVANSKTPLARALHLLPTLAEREIRALAKNKNIPNVIAAQARRIVLQKNSTRS